MSLPISDDTPARAADLLAWSVDPAARAQRSVLAQQPFLLLDAGETPTGKDGERLLRWLQQLPCPSIAITTHETPLSRACDVTLPDPGAAAIVLKGIRQSPAAAAVLVQLLRLTEKLPLGDALVAESLAYATLQSGPEYRAWLAANRAQAPVQPTDAGAAVEIERDGDLLQLHLNRPSNRNAMSVEMRDGLVEALQLVLADDSIRKVILDGRGRCFSTGGDLSEFGSTPDPVSGHLIRGVTLPGWFLAQCAARVEARLHGACIGSGAEFPAFAGRVVATADTHFQLPELKFGLIPGAGGCISIARRIGRQRTAWLVLSGKRITAAQALQWGLVDAVSG